MSQRRPIVWPVGKKPLRRLYLQRKMNGAILRDRHWTRRVAAAVAAVLLMGHVVLLTLILGVGVYHALGPTSSSGPGASGGRGATGLGEVVIMLLGGLIPGLLLIGLFKALRLDRSFTVRIDADRRRCVVGRKWMGWTTARREVDLLEADWDVEPAVVQRAVQPPVTVGTGLLAIALVLAGPLGWLIAIVRAMSRGSKAGGEAELLLATEVVRLRLVDHDGTQAVMTVTDEDVASAFLAVWDEARG